MRLAFSRLATAVAIVAVFALVTNNFLRVSQRGWTESKGYLAYYLEEHGLAFGVVWFAGATLIAWASLLLLAGRSALAARIAVLRQTNLAIRKEPGSSSQSGSLPELAGRANRQVIRAPTRDMGPLPEWLEEKATDAPTMVRMVADTVDMRLRRDYPRVLAYPEWHRFRQIGTIGGCVALALRLHVDMPQAYRTPLELAMRDSLELGFPGSAALYEDCACFVREALLEVDRPRRAMASTVLVSTWVFGVIRQSAPVEKDAPLVAELAQLYRREAEGYWVSGHGG